MTSVEEKLASVDREAIAIDNEPFLLTRDERFLRREDIYRRHLDEVLRVLEPFVKVAQQSRGVSLGIPDDALFPMPGSPSLTYGDLRRAAAIFAVPEEP